MVDIRLQGKQGKPIMHATFLDEPFAGTLYFSRQYLAPILGDPDAMVRNLIVRPAGFPDLQGIAHGNRIANMERVRIYSLKGISRKTQAIIRDGQMESARVWTLCRDMHLTARQNRERWPSRDEFHRATKRQFVLHSQSVQQVFRVFDAAVQSARENRRGGRKDIRYPYKDQRFYPLMWPAQAMHIEEHRIVLPMGRGRPSLILPRPAWLAEPGACKIVWNGLYNELHVSVSEPVEAMPVLEPSEKHATVDLGEVHQAAAVTNTGEALVVSGRGMRSLKRQHNQQLAEIQQQRSRCKKGSRRWSKLGKTRAKLTLRYARRIRDLRHKGTRQVVEFCKKHGVEAVFVGNPDGIRRQDSGRHHNQRRRQWEYDKDIDYLQQKAEKDRIVCFTGDERGTSSRCPVCGHRHKPKGRNWRCPACGFQGHRDVVGAVNMHPIAYGNRVAFPQRITYLRPGPLAGQATGMNNRRPGRSSSPDAGRALARERRCLAGSHASSTTRDASRVGSPGNSP